MLAIARSFESSGRAVLAISLLLVAQFGLLTTSDFIPTANFGLMTAVGLLSGQVAELLLLPALLVLKDGRRRPGADPPQQSPKPGRDERRHLGADGTVASARGGCAATGPREAPGHPPGLAASRSAEAAVLVCRVRPAGRAAPKRSGSA